MTGRTVTLSSVCQSYHRKKHLIVIYFYLISLPTVSSASSCPGFVWVWKVNSFFLTQLLMTCKWYAGKTVCRVCVWVRLENESGAFFGAQKNDSGNNHSLNRFGRLFHTFWRVSVEKHHNIDFFLLDTNSNIVHFSYTIFISRMPIFRCTKIYGRGNKNWQHCWIRTNCSDKM